ncbi:MAG TPA: gas vesicle protein GvpJ [Acidimicrobiales bacterium]|nr:gas vesicle protein GvpJ [Acidimicrobiales bacterium]
MNDDARWVDTQRDDDVVDLADLLDRLLGVGAAVSGDLVVSVAGVDLLAIGLRAVLGSVDAIGRPADATGQLASGPARSRDVPTTSVPAAPHRAAPGATRPAELPTVALPEDDPARGLVRLVLTLTELLRELMERQAIRRMDAGTLTADETDRLGTAMHRLAERMADVRIAFGLAEDDLALRLRGVAA